MPDLNDVRAVGTVECEHGAPLTVGVYRGHVNIAGRMLDRYQREYLAQLLVRADWLAAAYRTEGNPHD